MKNIQVIDRAVNCVYDIFPATDEQFTAIFPEGEDVAFVVEVYARVSNELLDRVFNTIRRR